MMPATEKHKSTIDGCMEEACLGIFFRYIFVLQKTNNFISGSTETIVEVNKDPDQVSLRIYMQSMIYHQNTHCCWLGTVFDSKD